MAKSKDLFDDSSMTFGEHLEVLRVHLIRALIGLAVAVIGCLFVGESILGEVRAPIDSALKRYGVIKEDGVDHSEGYGFAEAWEYVQAWWSGAADETKPKKKAENESGLLAAKRRARERFEEES